MARQNAKRANRPNPRTERNKSDNVLKISNYKRLKHVDIIPRSLNQDNFLGYLEDNSVDIVFGIGPAGSGKTLIATLMAIKMFKEGTIDKIVITRPNVAVDDRDIGFLPGGLLDKMGPWVRPILDIFADYYSPKEIEQLIEEGLLEICPIAYIRGRTFKNTVILVDEAQGTTTNSMLSILTRIGEGSKMFVTGDINQSDLGKNNGLSDFLERYTDTDRIKITEFNHKDVERHPVVKDVLNIYKDKG